jgi:hypothetical protein
MGSLELGLHGFPVVNNAMRAQLVDAATGNVVATRTPLRDGTVRFPDVPAGLYNVQVLHPNFVLPVTESGRPIRVLPTGTTKSSILIDPNKFKNTPIADIPDADLKPVIAGAEDIEASMNRLANKKGGEAIIAADWNALAGGVAGLANALAQLGGSVSPKGHNHPEYERKFVEITTNFETLLSTLSAAMAEIQRRLQIGRLLTHSTNVLLSSDKPDSVLTPARNQITALTDDLETKVTESPEVFADLFQKASAQIEKIVNDAIGTGGGKPGPRGTFNAFVEATQAPPPRSFTAELQQHQIINRRFVADRGTAVNFSTNFITGRPGGPIA